MWIYLHLYRIYRFQSLFFFLYIDLPDDTFTHNSNGSLVTLMEKFTGVFTGELKMESALVCWIPLSLSNPFTCINYGRTLHLNLFALLTKWKQLPGVVSVLFWGFETFCKCCFCVCMHGFVHICVYVLLFCGIICRFKSECLFMCVCSQICIIHWKRLELPNTLFKGRRLCFLSW